MDDRQRREELLQRVAALEEASREKRGGAANNAWDARYRILFERATDAIFIENDRDEILDANPRACELLGYTREELIGMSVPDIQAPECRGERGKVLQAELEDHHGKPFEAVDLHKDGTRIPVEVTNSRLDERGLFLSIVRDIRERMAAEQARREAYDILERSPVVAFLWRNAPQWPVEYVTPNVARIFGYSAEDFRSGRTVYSAVVHAEDLERVGREVTAFSQEPDRTEFAHAPYRIVTRDGAIRWLKDQTYIRRDPQGAITHYQGIVEDITDRVEAEQALRESEQKFSQAFHLSPDPVMITRLRDGRILDVNQSFLQASGYARQEVVGRNSVTDLNLWRDPGERQHYTEALLREGVVRNMALQFRIKNGDIRLGSVCGAVLELDGEPCILGTMRDITEERRAASQLAAEKERLSVTLRSIGDAVITTDRQGRITLMNPIAEDLTGWREADAVGQRLPKVFHIVNERTRETSINPVEKVLETGRIVGLANHTVLIARDGRKFFIADSGAPIFDAHGAIIGAVLVFRDTTERLQLEKELLKMEKLQSLGVLAGGIAHDFNNFLTGILGNLSLVKLDSPSGNPIARALDEMEKAALRAKDLTQQLLTFSKGGDPVKHTSDIAGLVHEAAQFALHGSNVRCDLCIDENLRLSEVDEGQIAQVLHNLILNADQAMPEGGTIVLRGGNVVLPPDNPYALAPGDYIRLSIEDQGPGIPSDHLKKVFDPYFTTKQQGSGLGLAVAYSVIAKHDGQLTVDSQLGKGTTFTILLPASDSARERAAQDPQPAAAGSGFILVMDDEDFIRDLTGRMLTKMGYRVAVAPHGQAALERYRRALQDADPFDAVILDLTVPGAMGGRETLQHLQTLDPAVRAIVSSGYANDPIMANHRDYGFRGAVQKPYRLTEMMQTIEAVLKEASGRDVSLKAPRN